MVAREIRSNFAELELAEAVFARIFAARGGPEYNFCRMAHRFHLVVFGAVLLCGVGAAQMRGFHSASERGHGYGLGRSFHGHHRGDAARGYFLGDTAYFYDDYPFTPAVPEVAAPQYMIAQAPAVEEVPAPKPASLLIELQGDHYVRYGGLPLASSDARQGTIGMREVPAGDGAVQPPPSELPATVLLYRDGHREDVADYAIVGRVMYAHRAGGTGGELDSIQVSALDVPATVRANRENGISFTLPAGPNDVVTRP